MTTDLSMMIDYDSDRLSKRVDDAMLAIVIPALREAVDKAARQLTSASASDNPFAHYAAGDLVIKALVDLLTLSDSEELERLSPAMLADSAYTDYWIRHLS